MERLEKLRLYTEISVLQNINKQQMHWKLKIINKNSIPMFKNLEVDTE